MKSVFPLVLLPKRVVYVDDQGQFLEILRKTMPKLLAREFISSPDAALNALSQETAYWRGIEDLLSKSHQARQEGTGEAAYYVKRYFSDWRRFHLTGVLIVDYAMPGMNGIELVKQLEQNPARRVLLTGEADAEVAIKAFNMGLIQKFIPKSTPNIYQEIRTCYEEMHLSVCEHMGHLIRATLGTEQIALLHEPAVCEALNKKIADLGWIEYLVVGQPFGLLGMASEGPLQWLQIETKESLSALAEAVEEYGYTASDTQQIRDGQAVVCGEILLQLGKSGTVPLVYTEDLTDEPHVVCAVMDLVMPVISARGYGLDDIMSPAEVMRSLLRDVKLAAGLAEDDGGGELALSDALDTVAATAALSTLHEQALDAALKEVGFPRALVDQIARRVALQRRRKE